MGFRMRQEAQSRSEAGFGVSGNRFVNKATKTRAKESGAVASLSFESFLCQFGTSTGVLQPEHVCLAFDEPVCMFNKVQVCLQPGFAA